MNPDFEPVFYAIATRAVERAAIPLRGRASRPFLQALTEWRTAQELVKQFGMTTGGIQARLTRLLRDGTVEKRPDPRSKRHPVRQLWRRRR